MKDTTRTVSKLASSLVSLVWSFLGGSVVKDPPDDARDREFSPWSGKILWRRKWPPTPVFFLEKPHGQRSLAGYRAWGREESDKPEQISLVYFSLTLLRSVHSF